MSVRTERMAEAGHRGGLAGFVARNIYTILGFAISGLCFWYIGSTFDFQKVGDHLRTSNWLLAVLCFVSVPFSMALKCVRWRYLFARQPGPPLEALLPALYIGYLINTVLPARVGEFVRAFLIGRHGEVGASDALASVVLEKLLDLATLAVLLIVLILVVSLPDWVTPIAYTSAAALGVGLAGLGVMLLIRRRVVWLVQLLESRVGLLARLGAARLAASFLDGLAGLGRRETLGPTVVWSVVVWASSSLTLWLGMTAVGLPVGLAAVLLVLVITNIGMAVPSAPGYLGVYYGLVVVSLKAFNFDEHQALAAAVVLHTLIFGNFVVIGLGLLWRGGHSLGSLRHASGH